MERLKKRPEFVAVSKTGNKWITPAFVIQIYQRAPSGLLRYGITASRKVGGAVERNRAKRRLRVLIKNILPSLGRPGVDYVFIARQEILKRDFATMEEELTHAVNMLGKKAN
ncbi:MAG: ribonuclease P protein component [Alphaproteobacteria bacterium]|nr:ribonuclease P protein component [Alphaproteobacteria bacterium]